MNKYNTLLEQLLSFVSRSQFEKVTLSNSVTYISNSTFGGCTKLKTINIPNSVKRIDSYAFYNCESLESIKIPASVTLYR